MIGVNISLGMDILSYTGVKNPHSDFVFLWSMEFQICISTCLRSSSYQPCTVFPHQMVGMCTTTLIYTDSGQLYQTCVSAWVAFHVIRVTYWAEFDI